MSGADVAISIVQFMINQNPIIIGPWASETWIDDNTGGRQKVTSTKGPYTVRIYMGKMRSFPQIIQNQVSEIYSEDHSFRMLMSAGDILDGTLNTDDEFDAPPYGHFKILSTVPLQQFGVLCGWLVDLQRIS